MSARSGVFVFDYDAHVNCVAPAVRRVLARHELGPWLQEVWDARQRCFPPDSRRTFRHPEVAEPVYAVIHLNADLSYSEAETPLRLLRGENWLPYEDLIELFGLLLRECCLGDGQAAGHGKRPRVLLENVLDQMNHDTEQSHPRARTLLRLLDRRAWCWTCAADPYSEGVHGWLTAAEARDLADELWDLPLPRYEPTWEGMRAFAQRPRDDNRDARNARHLSYVRTVASIAARQQRGILWGIDLSVSDHEQMPRDVLAWNDGTVVKIAQTIQSERRFDDLPILADALEDAGCRDTALIEHCREPGEHATACWVLGRLLGAAVNSTA
jgi:hypothetical protein